VSALSAGSGGRELVFSRSAWLLPTVINRLDLESLECSLHRRLEAPFEAEAFSVRQVWCPSIDGERIPMFLAHRKGLKLDGNNPAVVHGYGGFGVSLRPRFNPSIVAFLRAGGVYALANVRGGGEFGEEWHRAGARENKQTAIDDFNAAATWLISAGFTKPSRLASYGWSNGGMLANAAAQQQPGLWRAVVAGAPVADMARFHLFHSGRHWISEYGSPDIPEELAWLLRYSPCHNMPEAIEAPAVLLVAPDEDDRVAPWHSYKLLALWQASSVSGNPVLLLGEQRAGHRGGAAIESVVAREANIWSFLFWQLGVEAGRGDSR
jgi:prolyl oligopeptidase